MSAPIQASYLPGLGPVLYIDSLTHQLAIEDAERLSTDLHVAALQARLAQRQAADRALLASARARQAGNRPTAMETSTDGD